MNGNVRIMGVDYGESRIGVAVSDPFGWTAQGLETINVKFKLDRSIIRICELVKEYKVNRIVVGFPRNMNGTLGPRAEKTQEFIDLLLAGLSECMGGAELPEIVKWDERLTTVAANRTMHEMGVKTSKKKGVVDQIAAVYILQGYLDSISKKI